MAGPVEVPVHLRFVTSGGFAVATATRVLVVVEEGASAPCSKRMESTDGANHQPNDVVEMIAGDRTNVQHVRVNAEGDKALALSTLAAKIGGEAVFNSINVTAGSATSRHQVFAILNGENTNLRVNGATMLKGSQHGDSTLVVEHNALHCESRELFKTVVDNDATGVFQGKIIVPHHAQKTDGRMMSAALLLEEGGSMNNKRNSKSSPMTCSAPTALPAVSSTRISCSTSWPVASRRRRPKASWFRPSWARRWSMWRTRPFVTRSSRRSRAG